MHTMREQSEFSHTVLHGEHILKKAPLPVDAAPDPAMPPARQPAPMIPAPTEVPIAPLKAQPAPRQAMPIASEVEKLRAEAEKMRLRMEQIAKDRCAAVDAERQRLAAVREKERLEVHRMQIEKEARDRARREEKAKKMKDYEKKKADDAARLILEARAAADKRRAERDRPWAQQMPNEKPAEPMGVAGKAPRAAPAWLNNAPARKPSAPSPSNAVRDASPRNRSPPGGGDYSAADDADQYMLKLRERLKQKDEERQREKQAELSRLREKDRRDREAREQDRLEQARQEKERARALEQRAAEKKAVERQRQEELEARLREERIAERRRLEDIRVEKERLKARAEEAVATEKKRIAAESLAAEKERLRAEKEKLAQRLEEREKERRRREQHRLQRGNDGKPAISPRNSRPSEIPASAPSPSQKGTDNSIELIYNMNAATICAGRYAKADFNSDSSDEGSHPSRVTPAPASRQVQQASPASNPKRGGGLKLDWLANLEEEMGQLKGEMEKMSPHVRGGGAPGSQSPHVRASVQTPGDANSNIQFFKKNERPQLAGKAATPPVPVASPQVRIEEKPAPKSNPPPSAKVIPVVM